MRTGCGASAAGDHNDAFERKVLLLVEYSNLTLNDPRSSPSAERTGPTRASA